MDFDKRVKALTHLTDGLKTVDCCKVVELYTKDSFLVNIKFTDKKTNKTLQVKIVDKDDNEKWGYHSVCKQGIVSQKTNCAKLTIYSEFNPTMVIYSKSLMVPIEDQVRYIKILSKKC